VNKPIEQKFDEKFGTFLGIPSEPNVEYNSFSEQEIKSFFDSQIKQAITEVKIARTVDEAVKVLEAML
jgi:hypothetical protein